MRLSSLCNLSIVLSGLLLAIASAGAQTPPAGATPSARQAPRDESAFSAALRLDGYIALVHVEGEGWVPGSGAAAFVVFGPLEAGVSVLGETRLLGYQRVGLDAHLGVRIRASRFEFDVAGTVGHASVHRGGAGGLFSDDPGAKGSVSYVGGRAGLAFLAFDFNGGTEHISIGVAGLYEHDLDPHTITYAYREEHWFNGGSDIVERSVRIGGDRTGVLLTGKLHFY
jgi:hypothetical protein